MANDALAQSDAQALLKMEQVPALQDAFKLPDLGGRIEVPLISRDERERFSLDVNRMRIALTTGYQANGRPAVNDTFYVARANVESFFFEVVALWLDDADVRYTPRVNFVGHSRYNHQFDFVVPKSRRASERILRVINNPNNPNNPNKPNAQSAAFAWVDTKDVRPADSMAFAVLNDRDHKVSDDVQDALRSYEITPIAWTKREEFRERLAA